MIKEEEYIKAKHIVKDYEKQFSLSALINRLENLPCWDMGITGISCGGINDGHGNNDWVKTTDIKKVINWIKENNKL
jgi:peroxiredoxin